MQTPHAPHATQRHPRISRRHPELITEGIVISYLHSISGRHSHAAGAPAFAPAHAPSHTTAMSASTIATSSTPGTAVHDGERRRTHHGRPRTSFSTGACGSIGASARAGAR